MLEFFMGLCIGAMIACVAICTIASKKISEAYDEGFQHGREKALHWIERSKKDDRTGSN